MMIISEEELRNNSIFTDCEICMDLYGHGPCTGHEASKKPRTVASESLKRYRAYVKSLNGNALRGTAKQKEWAEKIRYDILRQLPEKHAKSCVTVWAGLDSAKAWINVRNADIMEIVRGLNALYAIVEESRRPDANRESVRTRHADETTKLLKLFGI